MHVICVIYVILQKLTFLIKGTHGNTSDMCNICNIAKLSFPIKGTHGNSCNVCNM